ncbi:GPP34 family phosphoprotein [Corynebacterium sp. sy039]|uniref:GOLPH3/VPS74 family protein n=1 Tax=Corynebacterium sp. sy039 TaxID=2599641 RepID=UPI0011B7DBCC|nr:GPP34 family phosphoprotein [Corynebacterium sp. sy039]QDZ42444.1 GPP34 family phosphoprotein [Corynebacterium sp. sy039]
MGDNRRIVSTDILLLLYTDQGKPSTINKAIPYALAGGLLADLTTFGKITTSTDEKKLVITSNSPTGHEMLDEALDKVRALDGKRLPRVLRALLKKPEYCIGKELAKQRIVTIKEKSFLGITRRTYPITNPSRKAQLHSELLTVLRCGQPNPAQETILSLIAAIGAEHILFREIETGLTKREVKKRISTVQKQAHEHNPSARLAYNAVKALQRQVGAMVATQAATAGTAGS